MQHGTTTSIAVRLTTTNRLVVRTIHAYDLNLLPRTPSPPLTLTSSSHGGSTNPPNLLCAINDVVPSQLVSTLEFNVIYSIKPAEREKDSRQCAAAVKTCMRESIMRSSWCLLAVVIYTLCR